MAPVDADASRALTAAAGVVDADSLPRLLPFLDREPVREAAAQACLAAADAALAAGKREPAVAGLTRLALLPSPLAVADAAAEKLRGLGVAVDVAQARGCITNWWLLGPFPNAGQEAYAPEKGVALDTPVTLAGKELHWRPWQEVKSTQGVVELLDVLGPAENTACYAYAEITSERAQDVFLKGGSDDGMLLWLNGERLIEAPNPRPLRVDDNAARAHLHAGVNRLLVKVLQGSSRWAFCVRLTDADGKPLPLPQKQALPAAP
ncbi:MAG TPA: hypothetical protein VHR86_02870 [Armatimonadota bacterium]|nr:hypothetical protein [Armatimonadota bacterium]